MAPADIEASVGGGAGEETKTEAPAPGFAPEVAPRHKLSSVHDYIDFFVAEMKHPTFVQSILAEWWATTLFLFFLILSVLPGANGGQEIFRIGVVAGLMIFALVYSFYAVSGGNINPAVSLGLVLSGRMTLPRAIGYIAAQIVGAITGVAMAKAVSPQAFNLAKGGINALQTLSVGVEDPVAIKITADQAFFGEVIGTLLLVLAVLFCTDTARSMEHPHMTALIPLTIGLVVLIDHLALIPIDGCSVNPARSLGSAIVYGNYDNMWVFTVGPFVGAIFAAVVYKLIFGPTEVFNEYLAQTTKNPMRRQKK